MIQLSPYGIRVVERFNFIGTWMTVVICCRNFMICYKQYRRSKGKIHLSNMAQVSVVMLHRFLYGIIPLFEIATCIYFPLLIALWHLAYILFYIVMFQRLIILEADHHSLWIKVVGIFLIIVRFVDLPFELVMYQITNRENHTSLLGDSCWATWQTSVLILNFIGDALANTFLSGMFIKRLYKHINSTKASTPQNQMIEYIARKSLVCLILTFFVNLIMNLFKITSFLGPYSDAFTVYFELIESTLLVEALRVDESLRANVGCSHCAKSSGNHNHNNKMHSPPSQKRSILQTFNSFDFVPLEERPSLSDSFQQNNNHSHQRYSTSSTSPANGGSRRRYPSIMDYSPSELYRNNLEDIIEMNPALSDNNNKGDNNNNEKRSIDHKTTTHTTSSNDLPASYTSSHSIPSTSPSTTAILSSSPSIPAPLAHQQHHYQQQRQQNNNSTGPMETLSSSLVHHPDWNNNHHDYKPF